MLRSKFIVYHSKCYVLNIDTTNVNRSLKVSLKNKLDYDFWKEDDFEDEYVSINIVHRFLYQKHFQTAAGSFFGTFEKMEGQVLFTPIQNTIPLI